ncbi:MAG: Integrase core domain [Nitrospira sp.]|jgi:transposase InsO family protein|nr:Integrase core domain [Nitrospira sp.]MDF2458683.1 Integrase core domain [Nitrospira sp.]
MGDGCDAYPVWSRRIGASGRGERLSWSRSDRLLQQDFITPYTPEQNRMIERSFRSLKEECPAANVPDVRESTADHSRLGAVV